MLFRSVAAAATLTSTNFSAGLVYPSNNGVPNTVAVPAIGNVLFVANSSTVSTNTLTLILRSSANLSTWTTNLTWRVSDTTPVKTNYYVGSLSKYWQVVAQSTNASAATCKLSVTALYFNKYQ